MKPVAREASPAVGRPRRGIGPVGTTARFVGGAGLLTLAWFERIGDETLIVASALVLAILILQLLYARRTGRDLNATGPTIFWVGLAVVAPLFAFDYTRSGVYVFFGLAMIVAAARGAGGCEATTITNLMLRRNDHLWCALYSPIDAAKAGRPRAG